MRERILRAALAAGEDRKAAAALKADEARQRALAVPEIARANSAYREAVYGAALTRTPLSDEKRQSLRKAYTDALTAHGFSESDFEPAPACPVCGGSGIRGGVPCECIREDYMALLQKECGLDADGYALEDFDAAKIPDPEQGKLLGALYSAMQGLVAKYPDVNRRIIVFSGGTGTGKTVLAEAMARQMLRKGLPALFMSAMSLDRLMLTVHTARTPEDRAALDDAMSADMLVIDDLGTEPRYRNVTCEYLLLLLSERARGGLVTVITTNLSPDRILARYNERIYSRMYDKRHALAVSLGGGDMRGM